MVKLYFDNYKVKNNIDYFTSAYNSMYKAVYYPGIIGIPYNFKDAEYLKRILDENYDMMNKILSNKNFLEKSLAKYESSMYNNETNILNIN